MILLFGETENIRIPENTENYQILSFQHPGHNSTDIHPGPNLTDGDIRRNHFTKLTKFNKLEAVHKKSGSYHIDYQGGNREMDQLYMTSQMSYITRKTTFSPIS